MVELSALSALMQEQLNDNKYGIKFDIKADRNEYEEVMSYTDDFVVPGVLTTLSGNYEPLQGIKVYYMPIALELFGFAQIAGELPPVPFTAEQQRACVENVVENLNGTTRVIGNNAVIFAGATVTVGNLTNDCGGGFTRLPLLVQLQLTVVENAALSNDVIVKIDGEQIYTNEFTVNMEKQTESYTYIGQAKVESLSAAKMRTFSGIMFLTDDAFYKTLEQDMLTNSAVNNTHELVFKGNSYIVETQTMSELLRMGAVVILQVTFIEVG